MAQNYNTASFSVCSVHLSLTCFQPENKASVHYIRGNQFCQASYLVHCRISEFSVNVLSIFYSSNHSIAAQRPEMQGKHLCHIFVEWNYLPDSWSRVSRGLRWVSVHEFIMKCLGLIHFCFVLLTTWADTYVCTWRTFLLAYMTLYFPLWFVGFACIILCCVLPEEYFEIYQTIPLCKNRLHTWNL